MRGTVVLTCFNCSEPWNVGVPEDGKIGPRERVISVGVDFSACDADVICISDSEGVHPVNCPVCGITGPHDIISESEYDGYPSGGEP